MITPVEPKVSDRGRYSVNATAQLLGVHRNTVRRWEDEGCIKSGFNKATNRKYYTGREIQRCWNRMA